MTDARELPEGSVVAGEREVYLKRTNAKQQPPGSPFYKECWINADTYAWPIGNDWINGELKAGRLTVLREGWGSSND